MSRIAMLEALQMGAAALARELAVPVDWVTEILAGHRAITGDSAFRLGQCFGTSAAFWLSLQGMYELRVLELPATHPGA